MTRSDILDASAQIFSQKGYHGTSMQDIADAVNLQKASLYHHVSSKQEILFALLNRGLFLLNEKVDQAISDSQPADANLRMAIKAYLKAMTGNHDVTSVLLLEYRSLEPNYLEPHIKERDRFELLWRNIIESGVKEGVFSCDDPAMAARALLGVMNWTVTWYRDDGPMSPQEIADQLTDLYLLGLTARPGNENGSPASE